MAEADRKPYSVCYMYFVKQSCSVNVCLEPSFEDLGPPFHYPNPNPTNPNPSPNPRWTSGMADPFESS